METIDSENQKIFQRLKDGSPTVSFYEFRRHEARMETVKKMISRSQRQKVSVLEPRKNNARAVTPCQDLNDIFKEGPGKSSERPTQIKVTAAEATVEGNTAAVTEELAQGGSPLVSPVLTDFSPYFNNYLAPKTDAPTTEAATLMELRADQD